MNKNLEKVLERIVEEEELTKEFSKYDDMDEMYEYCTELGGGYTEEEFDEGIAEAINALRRQGRETALSDEDMGYVAGGINLNGMLSKTAAVMLAALTAGSIGMPFGAKAAEIPQNTVGTQAVSVIKAEDSGKWSKTKEALSNFWKEHKKKIIIGTTVLTAAIVVSGVAAWAYKHREAVNKKADVNEAGIEMVPMSKIGDESSQALESTSEQAAKGQPLKEEEGRAETLGEILEEAEAATPGKEVYYNLLGEVVDVPSEDEAEVLQSEDQNSPLEKALQEAGRLIEANLRETEAREKEEKLKRKTAEEAEKARIAEEAAEAARLQQERSKKIHDRVVAQISAAQKREKDAEAEKARIEAEKLKIGQERALELEEKRAHYAEKQKVSDTLNAMLEKRLKLQKAEEEQRLMKEKELEREAKRKKDEAAQKEADKQAEQDLQELLLQEAEEEYGIQEAKRKRETEEQEAELRREKAEKELARKANTELAHSVGEQLLQAYEAALTSDNTEEARELKSAIDEFGPIIDKMKQGQELTQKEKSIWKEIRQADEQRKAAEKEEAEGLFIGFV